MGNRGGGVACPQVSHLLGDCWNLQQSSAVGFHPSWGQDPAVLIGTEREERGTRDCPGV